MLKLCTLKMRDFVIPRSLYVGTPRQ